MEKSIYDLGKHPVENITCYILPKTTHHGHTGCLGGVFHGLIAEDEGPNDCQHKVNHRQQLVVHLFDWNRRNRDHSV